MIPDNIDFFEYIQYLDAKEAEYRNRYRNYNRCKVRYDGSHYVASPMEVYIPIDLGKYRYFEDEVEKSIEFDIGKDQDKAKEIENNFIECFAVEHSTKNGRRHGRRSKDDEENPFADLFADEPVPGDYEQQLAKFRRQHAVKLNIERRRRFRLKAFNNEFNYFCTFTYSDQIMYEALAKKTWPKGAKGEYIRLFDEGRDWCKEHRDEIENSFRKKLRKLLQNSSTDLKWTYMGIFERGDKGGRLHFHCLANIPDVTVLGELYVDDYYSFDTRQRESSTISPVYSKKLGRANFEFINGKDANFLRSLNYILAYVGKSDNRIVYSRHLVDFKYADLPFDAFKIHCPERLSIGTKWWLLGDGVAKAIEYVKT